LTKQPSVITFIYSAIGNHEGSVAKSNGVPRLGYFSLAPRY
jgi:hypothetical protein